MKRFAAVWSERKVLALLVRRDLMVRYSNSFLGYLWTIIDPLANALIYFMLFVIIFQRSDAGHHPYFLFLLTGLLPWQWFNASVSESTRALLSEARLVKSTKLPREVWVTRLVLAKGAEFVLSLPVLLAFVIVYMANGDTRLDWELVYFPLAIVMQFILLIGIGLVLAPLTVMVNDIQPLIRVFLRILFYLTPIIFTLDLLPPSVEWLQAIYLANPLTGILELYRAGFFPSPVHWGAVLSGVIGTVLTLLVGITVFRRLESSVLKEI